LQNSKGAGESRAETCTGPGAHRQERGIIMALMREKSVFKKMVLSGQFVIPLQT